MDKQTASVSYFPSVAALVSYGIYPETIEKAETGLVFLFPRTDRLKSLLSRSVAGILHVKQGPYDAALNVCRDMAFGKRPLDPAEFRTALARVA